jgi:hypothetical protein
MFRNGSYDDAMSDEPVEDNSPYTGWTRRNWEDLADRMLAAVRPYATPGHALINLPGPASRSGERSDGLEGFARTFLLAAFRMSQSDRGDLAEWYAAGLAAGTDPHSPERWPTFAERAQAKVEAASIALALHETRPLVWDRLTDSVRQRVIEWLAAIIGDPIWENNWTWFQAIIEAFLRSVGGPWSAADIERTLDRTEAWYVGDGWYSDGTDRAEGLRNFDYYSGWAMHFYPLWYCRMTGPAADPLLHRYRARLCRYLADAQHLIGADGSPVFQGRSLTYRFAMLAPFWMGAIFDASPLSAGRTRRLASGVVRHFVSNGCFDDAGLLSLGWHGAFPLMRQPYSGPGSPYWASKAFAGLVLPADHPVWTDVEEPLAIEQGDVAVRLARPGWLVSGTAADGVVRVAAHGPDHAPLSRPSVDEPEYARYGFSSHAAPEMELVRPVDSHIALLTDAGAVSHRRPVRPVRIQDRAAVSRSRAHWPVGVPSEPWGPVTESGEWVAGPEVTSASVLRGAVEVRLALVEESSEVGPLWLRMGGWAIADEAEPVLEVAGASVTCRRADGLTSTVVGLRGLSVAGWSRGEGRNPMGAMSATPWVVGAEPVLVGEVYAALVVLSGVGVDLSGVGVEVAGRSVTVRWADGAVENLVL